MENHALDIIDMLYTMIVEAWGVPLGNDRCIIERDKALGLLDDLKAVLPGEMTEARRLLIARDDFVANAKQEAQSIRANAEEEARSLVDQQAVLAAARAKAEETIRDSEKKARDARLMVSNFVDEALRKTEESISASLESIRATRSQFRTATAVEPEGKVDVTIQDVEDDELLS